MSRRDIYRGGDFGTGYISREVTFVGLMKVSLLLPTGECFEPLIYKERRAALDSLPYCYGFKWWSISHVPCMKSLHENAKRTRQEIVVLLHNLEGIFYSFLFYIDLNYFAVRVNLNEKLLKMDQIVMCLVNRSPIWIFFFRYVYMIKEIFMISFLWRILW